MPKSPKKKFIFVVQGEGRGHMTQAIAMHDILIEEGHEISAVIVGKSKKGDIPAYFFEHMTCEVTGIDSPGFIKDDLNKSIQLKKTIFFNLFKANKYIRNLKKIDEIVEKHKPDTIINFYDFLCGVYFLVYRPKINHIVIGHQYLLEHPDFVFPDKISKTEKLFYFLNTQITAFRANTRLALSFKPMEHYLPDRIHVVPPLLRKEVLALHPSEGDYILVYMVYSGFLDDVIAWHKQNRDVIMHIFTDKKDIIDEQILNDTLTLHKLNDVKFLQLMNNCKAYASTAGFESVCEAMYLGKPVLMVPPEGHFEQMCNALDACLAGAGIQSNQFHIEKLLNYLPHYHKQKTSQFRTWVQSAKSEILKYL
ncbi:MAG: glycosyltransferase family protein [Bacteroidota bacterium]|nr:glycosyltransferase family protein [Bacteroidota bacterium]